MVLVTERLILRPLEQADAATVQRLAGDSEIARTTLHIPHPYPEGAASEWIEATLVAAVSGRGCTWAITRRDEHRLIGVVSLGIVAEHGRAELAYWLGKNFWGQGYTTEAAQRLVEHGFATLNLHRIYAYAMARNPASSRVMQKIGMMYEGRLVQHICKWGDYEDLDAYGILNPLCASNSL